MGAYTSKQVKAQEHKKHRYLRISIIERLQECREYKDLRDIEIWPDYHKKNITITSERINPTQMYTPNDGINNKVSLYNGDITELGVDAIVNSASKSIYHKPKGQVNNAICQKAGKSYIIECGRNRMDEAGQAMITGGYKLPAKHVINTLAPKGRKQSILEKCYENSLDQAKHNDLETIAFPCIGVKKKKNFDAEEAAKIALNTVRGWLENNHNSIERVIFCVIDPDCILHYEWLMQEYFPVLARSSSAVYPGTGSSTSHHAVTPNLPERTLSRWKPVIESTKLDEAIEKTQAIGSVHTPYTGRELSTVKRWDDYYLHDLHTNNACHERTSYRTKETINRQVALVYGNIVELGVDAIVNSVDTKHRGGQVNHAVRAAAGDDYGRQCDSSGTLNPGEARSFSVYRHAFKFVINTSAPEQSHTDILNNCYTNSLTIARENTEIKSLAFPCIATRTNHGMNKLTAANIGLGATRDWLERNDHRLDLVVFCVYTKEDLEIYEQRMQYYFPCVNSS